MKTTTIKVKIDPLKVAKGHSAHTTGSGRHSDKRTKRRRTRSAKQRAAIREFN